VTRPIRNRPGIASSIEARAKIEEAAKLEPGSKERERLRALIAWHFGDAAEAQRILSGCTATCRPISPSPTC
jgi:hypothetical protein